MKTGTWPSMSEAVFANLPRFDAGDAASALRRLNLPLAEAPAEDPVVAAYDDATDPATDAAEPPAPSGEALAAETAADPAALEAMLTALSETIDRLEREAQDQVSEAIQSMAAQLFPELSKQFLAEEVSRHLPALVPVSVSNVEIRAEPALAHQLRPLVNGMGTLASRCTVLPVEAPGDSRVHVSWQTGGVTFDFRGLMDACLARLDSKQATIGV